MQTVSTQQLNISKKMPRSNDISVVRVLCLGDDTNLLATRVAVLRRNGYEAVAGDPAECKQVLCESRFDLIVASHSAHQSDMDSLISIFGATPVLRLALFTLPDDLLAAVKENLVGTQKP